MRISWLIISSLIGACGASGTSAPGLPTPDVYVDQKIYKDTKQGIASKWEYNIYSDARGAVAPSVMIEFWFSEPFPDYFSASSTILVRRKAGSSYSSWIKECGTPDSDPNPGERAYARYWNKENPKSKIELHETRRRVTCKLGTVGSSHVQDIAEVWLMGATGPTPDR